MQKILVLVALQILSVNVWSEDSKSKPSSATQFQSESESVTEETIEQKDGKTTRTLRSGKPRTRDGEPRVGEIEEGETKKFKRRHESLNLSAVGFGPFGSAEVGEGKLLYGFSYGKIWEVSDVWEIRGDAFAAFNADGSFYSLGFGPSYIPMTGELSPFFGVELGFGGAVLDKDEDEDGAAGFYGQGNVGLKMFRLSNTQMEILGSYSVVFTEQTPGIVGVQFRLLFQ